MEGHVQTPDAPAATSLDAKYLSEGSSPAAELSSSSALHFSPFFFSSCQRPAVPDDVIEPRPGLRLPLWL